MPVKRFEKPVIKQFPFAPFSKKQLKVFGFWDYPKYKNKIDAIICDGSVRSGKTLSMIISYIEWSMNNFNHAQFGIAGQSIGSLRKNVIKPMKEALAGWSGFDIHENRSESTITIKFGSVENIYYMYGGRDESSQNTVQGLQASGFFFDEVALQPQSFVNQCTARVDNDDGLFWFNCNPNSPYHWFYREWILDEEHKHKTLHLHFTMDDNLYLTKKVKDRFKRSYSGVFYDRYILGKWVMASGLVYSNFDAQSMVVDAKDLPPFEMYDKFVVSADYGDMNPTVFTLWGHCDDNNVWYGLKEYYYDGRHHFLDISGQPRRTNIPHKSDEQYVQDMDKFLGKIDCPIILDPSAKNFAIALYQHGYKVIGANNDVNNGISLCQVRMNEGRVKFSTNQPNQLREFGSYSWDAKAAEKGIDRVIKRHDHCSDDFRYMVVHTMPPTNENDSGYRAWHDR